VLKKTRKRIKHPKREVLKAVCEGLEEIEGHFEWEGFSNISEEIPHKMEINPAGTPTKPSAQVEVVSVADAEEEEVEPEADEDGFDSDEDSSGNAIFQREDIEVAIDLFVTHLIHEEIIEEPATLEDVFVGLFGEDHPVIDSVRTFEEHIKGYFGAIAHEDMNIAFGNLAEIRAIVEKEMARHAKN
jgi:hypothetical protein